MNDRQIRLTRQIVLTEDNPACPLVCLVVAAMARLDGVRDVPEEFQAHVMAPSRYRPVFTGPSLPARLYRRCLPCTAADLTRITDRNSRLME